MIKHPADEIQILTEIMSISIRKAREELLGDHTVAAMYLGFASHAEALRARVLAWEADPLLRAHTQGDANG